MDRANPWRQAPATVAACCNPKCDQIKLNDSAKSFRASSDQIIITAAFFFEQNYGCKKSKKTQSVDSPLWPMWALLGRVSLLCLFLKPFVTPPNLCPPWRRAAGSGQWAAATQFHNSYHCVILYSPGSEPNCTDPMLCWLPQPPLADSMDCTSSNTMSPAATATLSSPAMCVEGSRCTHSSEVRLSSRARRGVRRPTQQASTGC